MFALFAILFAASVESAEVCRAIVDGKCEGASREFTSDVGSIAFITTVEGLAPGSTVFHVWRRDGKRARSVRLRVAATRSTLHSELTIGPSEAGDWSVEVAGLDGKRLATRSFKIREAATGPNGGVPSPRPGKGKREPKPVPYQPPQQQP
jgi:hypothetical protein